MSNDKSQKTEHTGEMKTVSERKLLANRSNAQKSTGPRTPAGKRASSFNSTTHGLLARLAPAPEDESLNELRESLRAKYGRGEVRIELLIDSVVSQYWRQRRVVKYEEQCLEHGVNAFHHGGPLLNIDRYSTASRRALLQVLELLENSSLPEDETAMVAADDETNGEVSDTLEPPG
jgi:hypothetical protein